MHYRRTQTKVGQYGGKNMQIATCVLPFGTWNKSRLRHGGLFSVHIT